MFTTSINCIYTEKNGLGRRLNWSWRSKKTTHILFWKSLDVESKRILVQVLRISYEAST